MGLLDDAIREHLDLKRRRGADPNEVERDEREALGPVRRGPDEVAADGPELEHAAQNEHAGGEAEVGDAWDHDHEPHEEATELFDVDDSEGEEPQPPPAAPADPLSPEPPEFKPPEPHRAPAPESHEPPPEDRAPAETLGDETVEYDVEGALEREEAEGDDDDVLEETPEFLQDTPDHDRLWFEQKPPRDFDFDG